MEFWDLGGILAFPLAEHVPSAAGAIPKQIPSLGMEPLCQKVRDRNRKLHAFEKLGFFSVWTHSKTT